MGLGTTHHNNYLKPTPYTKQYPKYSLSNLIRLALLPKMKL